MGKGRKNKKKAVKKQSEATGITVLAPLSGKPVSAYVLRALESFEVFPQEDCWEVVNISPQKITVSKKGKATLSSVYEVENCFPGLWNCTCRYHQTTGNICKHIKAVQASVRLDASKMGGPLHKGQTPPSYPRFLLSLPNPVLLNPFSNSKLGGSYTIENAFIEREVNPFGVSIENDQNRYALKVRFYSKKNKKYYDAGYLPNRFIRNFPEVLDPNKRFRLSLTVQRVPVGSSGQSWLLKVVGKIEEAK